MPTSIRSPKRCCNRHERPAPAGSGVETHRLPDCRIPRPAAVDPNLFSGGGTAGADITSLWARSIDAARPTPLLLAPAHARETGDSRQAILMFILGVSCYYHDAAAALIQDGQLIAAAE